MSSKIREKINLYRRNAYKNNPFFKERVKRNHAAILNRRSPLKKWAMNTLIGHRCKGYIVNLSWEDLMLYVKKEGMVCKLCNVTMTFLTKNNLGDPSGISLDRIDNFKEINLNNIQIICRKCNITKSNRSMIEFIQYCKDIVDKFKNIV